MAHESRGYSSEQDAAARRIRSDEAETGPILTITSQKRARNDAAFFGFIMVSGHRE